jgi:hypothetical protein
MEKVSLNRVDLTEDASQLTSSSLRQTLKFHMKK